MMANVVPHVGPVESLLACLHDSILSTMPKSFMCCLKDSRALTHPEYHFQRWFASIASIHYMILDEESHSTFDKALLGELCLQAGWQSHS